MPNRFKFILAIFLVTGLFFFLRPKPASAEFYLDNYGGIAIPQDTDVYANIYNSDSTKENVNYKTSQDFVNTGTFGLKVGYWLRPLPYLGFAVDVQYLRLVSEDVSARTISYSPLLMARLPLLVNQTYTHGRFQPYIGAGIGISDTEITVDYRPHLSKEIKDSDSYNHYITIAGLLWQFYKHIGTFIEYRFMYSELRMENKEVKCTDIRRDYCAEFSTTEKEEIKTDLSIHSLVMGLSIRF